MHEQQADHAGATAIGQWQWPALSSVQAEPATPLHVASPRELDPLELEPVVDRPRPRICITSTSSATTLSATNPWPGSQQRYGYRPVLLLETFVEQAVLPRHRLPSRELASSR
ncbi:MAG: hypothetical protein J5I81_07310 [Nitrococcus mobilis]|nr:hypothetical protein [Nitrococcus mobilis]